MDQFLMQNEQQLPQSTSLTGHVFSFFKSPSAILAIHFLFKAIQLGFAAFYDHENPVILIPRTGVFIFIGILSYLAWKKKTVAIIFMVIMILISGLGGFISGIFVVPLSQYFFKPFAIIISAYFIFGGIHLFFFRKELIQKRKE